MKAPFRSLSRCTPALIAFSAGALLGALTETLRHDRKIGFTPDANTVAPQKRVTTEIEPTVDPVSAPPIPVGTTTRELAHLTRLEALSRLNHKLQRKIGISLFRGENLNDDFVRLYELSSAEAEKLRHAFASTRQKVNELQARQATIAKTGDDEFRILIADAPAEGGVIHDELMQAIRETLGPQRFRYYETLSPVDFERSTHFDRFGLAQWEIHLKPTRDENGKPTAMRNTTLDRGDGGLLQFTEIDPALFPARFPVLHQKMIASGFLSATP